MKSFFCPVRALKSPCIMMSPFSLKLPFHLLYLNIFEPCEYEVGSLKNELYQNLAENEKILEECRNDVIKLTELCAGS